MKITYCGNSYFILESSSIKIAIDPHDGGSLNLRPCTTSADYIIITHDHYDHNAYMMAFGKNTKRILRGKEGQKFRLENAFLEFYDFYHDSFNGAFFGKVSGFKLLLEGMNIVNLSDIGQRYEATFSRLKPIDILMIPIGGVTTIGYEEAYTFIEELKPKIVLPMHYWIKGSNLPYDSIDSFIKNSRFDVEFRENNVLTVKKESLQDNTKIIVLNYA
ncbi:MAG: MBL fold metallo-hydrolase [Caldisphaeraceae archaeon]|nr:MBL fold metallo-hydrolase [Caldisphaeraceae archaeon]